MSHVRAKHQTYLDTVLKQTYSRWHPQIKVNGQWAYLPDDTTKTKLAETEDEVSALEQAISAFKTTPTQGGK